MLTDCSMMETQSYTLIFYTVKKIFLSGQVSRPLFFFLMNQSYIHCRRTTLVHLQDGVTNSEKVYAELKLQERLVPTLIEGNHKE